MPNLLSFIASAHYQKGEWKLSRANTSQLPTTFSNMYLDSRWSSQFQARHPMFCMMSRFSTTKMPSTGTLIWAMKSLRIKWCHGLANTTCHIPSQATSLVTGTRWLFKPLQVSKPNSNSWTKRLALSTRKAVQLLKERSLSCSTLASKSTIRQSTPKPSRN